MGTQPWRAREFAQLGVILLMFGTGLHFSLDELLSVKTIALPGAMGQIAVVTLLGVVLTQAIGWSIGAGVVFGLALSVASTVVVLRTLQEKRLVETERRRIAVGWLVVEDLAMVLALIHFCQPSPGSSVGGPMPQTLDQPAFNRNRLKAEKLIGSRVLEQPICAQ